MADAAAASRSRVTLLVEPGGVASLIKRAADAAELFLTFSVPGTRQHGDEARWASRCAINAVPVAIESADEGLREHFVELGGIQGPNVLQW